MIRHYTNGMGDSVMLNPEGRRESKNIVKSMK
jgi:hypothetical protein